MANSLKVDIGSLTSLSTYLTEASSEVTRLLDQMQTDMSSISSSWTDNAGNSYKTQFESFIKESKNICSEIDCIKKFLDTVSDYYSNTIDDYYGMLGD